MIFGVMSGADAEGGTPRAPTAFDGVTA